MKFSCVECVDMDRYYSFAGITFRIVGDDEKMYQDDGVLAPYAVLACAADHTVEFDIVEQLTPPDGECLFQGDSMQVYGRGDSRIRYCGSMTSGLEGAYLRIERQGSTSRVQGTPEWTSNRISARMALNALEAEHHIVSHGGFLLHSSFIKWRDEAILFTAPSQTGKSTQAALWSKLRGAEQINGDRAAVMVENNGARAWGIPFCGSSGISKNVNAPLRAIVYLTQASETSIARLTGLRAFSRVWEGCCVNSWDRGDLEQCTDAVMKVIASVPVFHLACTPDETAVIALERAMEEMR